MNKIMKLLLFILITNATALFSQNTLQFTIQEQNYIKQNKHISIAMQEYNIPFSYIEDEYHLGMTKDILTLISNKTGLQFDIKINNEINNILDFKLNKVDMIADVHLTKNTIPRTQLTQIYCKEENLRFAINQNNTLLYSIINKTLAHIPASVLTNLKKRWVHDLSKNVNKNIILNNQEKAWIKQNSTITVQNEKAWIPFNFYEQEPMGYSIDYINLLAKKLGLQVKFISGPSWNQFLKMIKSEELDVMLNIVETQERSKYLKFTEAYKISKNRIYSLSNNSIKTLDDLKGKTIALQHGFSTEEWIKKYYPSIKIKYYSNIENRLKAVSFGNVEATLSIPEVAEVMIKRHLITNVSAKNEINFMNEQIENEFKLRFAVNKNNHILHQLLDKAIQNVSYNEKNKLETKWFYNDLRKIEQKITKEEKLYLKNHTFNIATTNTWSPFNFIGENKQLSGIGVDYLQLIIDKLDLQSKIVVKDSFTQVLSDIKEGKADFTFSTTNTQKRNQYALFSKAYEKFPIAIASTNEKKFIPNASLLEGKKVAVGKGYSAYYLLKDKYPHIQFIFTKDTKEALQMVKDNKVYAAIDILPALQFYINNDFENSVKISGTTNIFFEIKFMIQKQHKHLLTAINKAIDSINNDQKNEIYRKWLLSPKNGIDKNFFYQVIFWICIVFLVVLIWTIYILKSKKRLLEEKKKLDDILTSIPVPILITNNKTRKIIFANTYATIQYGIELDQLIGKSIDVLYVDNNDKHNILNALDDEGRLINYETKYKASQGQIISALLSVVPLHYNNEEARLGIISDISKLKETQQALNELNLTLEDRVKKEVKKNEDQQFMMFQQSRHAQMGEMIAMIAHQWRQPLNVLSLILQNVAFKYELNKLDKDTIDSLITKGNTQIVNMSNTIDDFRNFFKPDKESKEFSLNQEIHNVLNILNPLLKEHDIFIDFAVTEDIVLWGYQNEFSQAIINIINNSKDALIEKKAKDRNIKINLEQTANKIIITIEDNAGGISEEIIEKIFTPYFSTKSSQIGTGLGLHMSKMILEEHMKGKINVNNTRDGAKFTISFTY